MAGLLRRLWRALRLPFQIVVTIVIGLVLPFLAYAGLDAAGLDVTWPMYLAVVVMLLVTATLIWVEGLLALAPTEPPPEVAGALLPAASAIISAYLPNEAMTIVETVEAVLRVDYPALQVILAYNTPRDLPVEERLREIAARDPRFVPLRVHGSTSKAQNVNAAVGRVTGRFVGVFDADHHPDPDSFRRAWRWLSNGFDVVQGHCVIRNGTESWVARLVAVEFEQIYGVSHPGRARLHGFGIFGGSNGYWNTALLRLTRMHHFMLTEDIDSSLRVILSGYRIASDRALISRELAPTGLRPLAHQRLRWAQGWFQTSIKWFVPALVSRELSLRQKLGFFHLLAWREFFPWITIQVIPIMAYWTWAHGWERLDWFVPLFVATTLYTVTTGPGQIVLSYFVAHETIRRHAWWFAWAGLMSLVFYTAFKNLIVRVAHVKELMRERIWRVTPRVHRPHVEPFPSGKGEPRDERAPVGLDHKATGPGTAAAVETSAV